jgi:hypothetical protein
MMTTRKPRAIPATTKADDEAPVTVKTLAARSHALWIQIRTEYVTRPDAPSLETLAKKYVKQVSYEAIRKRAQEEKWTDRREKWWMRAEVALLQRIQDQYLSERIEEMRLIRQAMPFVFEHLLPVMEKDPDNPGQKRVKRDPDTGMPVFRHGFKSQEGVVKTWLLLQERQMLLRGEATMRTDSAIRDRMPVVEDANDPISNMAKKANFSRDEVRSLARQMIAKRMSADMGEPEPADEDLSEAEEDDDAI